MWKRIKKFFKKFKMTCVSVSSSGGSQSMSVTNNSVTINGKTYNVDGKKVNSIRVVNGKVTINGKREK